MSRLDDLPPLEIDFEREAREEEERAARRRAVMGSGAQQPAVQGAVAQVERARSSTRGGAVVVDCDAMEEAPSRRRVKQERVESASEERISDSDESWSDGDEE
jgi:sirohydrochlorin ferrochelatase